MKRVVKLILIIATMLISVDRFANKAAFNLASIILNKAIWQGGQTGIQRQKMLSGAVLLLEQNYEEISTFDDRVSKQCSMIPSLATADYHRKQRDFETMLVWLRRALNVESTAVIQDALILPSWISINQKGSIVLDWSDRWQFRGDSRFANLVIDGESDYITITFDNASEQKGRVIYQWNGPLDVPYWYTILIHTRVHAGTFLTFEVHSDTGVQRYVNYHRGQGVWEDFTIPLATDSIRWIYISLSDSSSDSSTSSFGVDMSPIVIAVDADCGETQ